MGQHKFNPIAIDAKNGDIPPKDKPMGKAERDMLMRAMVAAKFQKTYKLPLHYTEGF